MRTPTYLILSTIAASVLALSSCATPDHSQHGAAPAPQAAPSSIMPSTHSGHSPSSPPSASASPSTSASEDHSEHTGANTDEPETYDGTHREEGHHAEKDDTYKDVALDKGEEYVIQSSTDATKFRLTIEGFGCKTPYPKAGYTDAGKEAQFKAKPGFTLCVATVKGENIGKAPDHAALNYFATVVDSQDKLYDETTSPSFTTQFLMDGKPSLRDEIDPGESGWMVLGYEVPVKAQGLELRIDTAPPSH